MAAAPSSIREFRVKYGTTFNTTFTNAAAASWINASLTSKLRIIAYDAGGLEYTPEDDPTLESQLLRGRAPIATKRGPMPLAISMWGEGAESSVSENPLATLLSKVLGGIASPVGARTATALGTGDTDTVNSTGIGAKVVNGQGLLCGTRGDSAGNGEFRVIIAEGTDTVNIGMALPVAMSNTHVATISTTVFPDPTATQNYVDWTAIGYSAEDQQQGIGAMGGFSVEGLNPGELPKFSFDLQNADWQEVASGDRDVLIPATTPLGNDPAANRGTGGFFLADAASPATRVTAKIANLTFDPGITYEAIPDPNGVNGVGGWQMVPSTPTMECDIILEGGTEPLPGLYDDYTAQTAKAVIAQFGTTATKMMAIDMPKCYVAAAPKRTTVGNLAAVHVVLRGTADDLTAVTTQYYREMAAFRIHFC